MTAFSPIPLASAIGKFAQTPISTQQIPAAAAVPATAASRGTPAAARMAGLANKIYAIVRNVATAPRSSVSVYGVSSTVSCSSAAQMVSVFMPSSAKIVATASGWVMYGSPLSRFCSRCQ